MIVVLILGIRPRSVPGAAGAERSLSSGPPPTSTRSSACSADIADRDASASAPSSSSTCYASTLSLISTRCLFHGLSSIVCAPGNLFVITLHLFHGSLVGVQFGRK